MRNLSYQTETKESDNKDCVLVFAKNELSILTIQKVIETLYYVKKTERVDAERPSTGEKTKAICVYPTNDISTQDLKHLIKEVLCDGEILTMRRYLSKRRDILKDYDRVIMKMEKNEWNQNLINDMQKLLDAILGDFTVNQIILSINQTCEKFTYPEDSDSFIAYEKTMALFNAINKYIVDCVNNTIVA